MFPVTAPLDASMISVDILLLGTLIVGFGFWLGHRLNKKSLKKMHMMAISPMIVLLGLLSTGINLLFQFTGR